MILEVATLNVIPGQEQAFETAFQRAAPILASMHGYISHELRRCIEHTSRYLLLVQWQTLEDHNIGFRGSLQYQDWKSLLHHFYDPFPTVEHYNEPLRHEPLHNMTDVITVRKAQPPDAAAIAECLASAFAPFRSQYTAGAFADTVLNTEGVLNRMAHMTIYAGVTSGGQIVGTVSFSIIDQIGHLRGMAFGPNGRDTPSPNNSSAQQRTTCAPPDAIASRLNTTAPLHRAIRFYRTARLHALRQSYRVLRHATPRIREAARSPRAPITIQP